MSKLLCGIVYPMPQIEVYLCISEDDLRSVRKSCDWDIVLEMDETAEATHWAICNAEKEESFHVVSAPAELAKKYDRVVLDTLLVHEACHVVDSYFKELGEDMVGSEAYAYTLQAVAQYLISEYHRRVDEQPEK